MLVARSVPSRLLRTLPVLAMAAALFPLTGSAPALSAAVGASPACEVATPGGLEVRAKAGAKSAEPDASRGAGSDLLQGREPTSLSPAGSITVPTRVHVIAQDRTAAGGYLTQAQVDAQLAVLNAAFAGRVAGGTTASRSR